MRSITPRFFRLTTEDKPKKSEAPVGSELIVLDGDTGKVVSLWILADRANPVSSGANGYWWQI